MRSLLCRIGNYFALISVSVLFCVGCDSLFDIDRYPVSVMINGEPYESHEENTSSHENAFYFYIDQNDYSFTFNLHRRLYSGAESCDLYIELTGSGTPELNKKYPVSRHTKLYTDHWMLVDSGWVKITRISYNSLGTPYKFKGEFELFFGDGEKTEQTILSEGRFGPMKFSYHDQRDDDQQ